MSQTKAIIIGASSQLSQQITRQLSQKGIRLALLVQNPTTLIHFAQQLPTRADIFPLNITHPEQAIAQVKSVWEQLNGSDLILVNTGMNQYSLELPWQLEESIIAINVRGFAAICNTAFTLFKAQGYGQLAAINSIAGLRGGANVSYHASKAFSQNYLEGLSLHAQRLKLPITITDIQLGLLDKAAMQQNKLLLAPLPKVASQILTALAKGKRKVYVTKRWRIIAWIIKLLPEFIYNSRKWK